MYWIIIARGSSNVTSSIVLVRWVKIQRVVGIQSTRGEEMEAISLSIIPFLSSSEPTSDPPVASFFCYPGEEVHVGGKTREGSIHPSILQILRRCFLVIAKRGTCNFFLTFSCQKKDEKSLLLQKGLGSDTERIQSALVYLEWLRYPPLSLLFFKRSNFIEGRTTKQGGGGLF